MVCAERGEGERGRARERGAQKGMEEKFLEVPLLSLLEKEGLKLKSKRAVVVQHKDLQGRRDFLVLQYHSPYPISL